MDISNPILLDPSVFHALSVQYQEKVNHLMVFLKERPCKKYWSGLTNVMEFVSMLRLSVLLALRTLIIII